jgi:hypothetical protein
MLTGSTRAGRDWIRSGGISGFWSSMDFTGVLKSDLPAFLCGATGRKTAGKMPALRFADCPSLYPRLLGAPQMP